MRDLLRNSAPLLLLANLGVLLAALVTGYLVHWTTGLPVETALLFGAIISATDPISVLAMAVRVICTSGSSIVRVSLLAA